MSATKALPPRASRGTRIHKLIGEEAEADNAFWNQDAWNEDGEDSDYSSEEEEADVVDSDFDEEENPDDDIHGDEEDDTGGNKRKRGRPSREEAAMRRVYQEPQRGVKRPRRAASGESVAAEGAAGTPWSSAASVISYEVPTLRQSTAKKSSESSDLRRKIFEEAARLAAKVVKKPQIIKTRLTQEQLLMEAVRTEVENMQSLNRLERLEEEKKAENVLTPKAPFTGVIVRYHSRIGAPKTITFLNTDRFPSIFNQQQPRKRERLAPKEELMEEDDDADDGEEEEEDEEEQEVSKERDTVEEKEESGGDTAESK